MTSSTTQAVATVLTEVVSAVLSKFRRKWLERQAGTRVFISDGREAARVEALEAAKQTELELEQQIHAQRNAAQAKLLEEETQRRLSQQSQPQEEPPTPAT